MGAKTVKNAVSHQTKDFLDPWQKELNNLRSTGLLQILHLLKDLGKVI
jgi:uncharacterized protein YjgD (DUF1641 family)